MSAIQGKLDERGKIYNQMKDLKDRAKKEDRSMSEDEKRQWEAHFTDYNKLGEEIKSLEKDYEIDQKMDQLEYEQKSVFDRTPKSDRGTEKEEVTYKGAFSKWVRNQTLSVKDLNILQTRGTSTQITSTPSLGGYMIPEEWHGELVKTMETYGGMLQAGRIISTDHGREINITTIPYAGGGSSSTQKGVRIGENVQSDVNDITLGQKVLNAYVYSSGEIQWTWEMMEDSMFPIVPLTMEIGGERVGRIVNEELTTANGSSKPQGVVPATSAGKTASSNSALDGDELVDLKYSVNSAYRGSNKCVWMMNDATLGEVVKLSYGTDDTSVWVPSFREGAPDRILGHAYIVNDDMADIGSEAKPVLFGDFNKYWIRQAGFPEMARSDERDIAYRRSVFYVFARYDGELVDANAIKHLVQPS